MNAKENSPGASPIGVLLMLLILAAVFALAANGVSKTPASRTPAAHQAGELDSGH